MITDGAIELRLRAALTANKMSVRAFITRMAESGVKGGSSGSVYGVLRGKSPTLEFLETAAQILDVRLSWLVDGDGAMRRGKVAHDTLIQRARERRSAAEAGIAEEFPRYGQLTQLAQWLLWNACVLLFSEAATDGRYGSLRLDDPDTQREMGRKIGRTLTGLLAELGPSHPSPAQLHSYAVAVASAIAALNDFQLSHLSNRADRGRAADVANKLLWSNTSAPDASP